MVRPVRRSFSFFTTGRSRSVVSIMPFIRKLASPALMTSTAFTAASAGVPGASTMSKSEGFRPMAPMIFLMSPASPTRMGWGDALLLGLQHGLDDVLIGGGGHGHHPLLAHALDGGNKLVKIFQFHIRLPPDVHGFRDLLAD